MAYKSFCSQKENNNNNNKTNNKKTLQTTNLGETFKIQ